MSIRKLVFGLTLVQVVPVLRLGAGRDCENHAARFQHWKFLRSGSSPFA